MENNLLADTAETDFQVIFKKQLVRAQQLRKQPWQNRKKLLRLFGAFILQNRPRIHQALKADLGKSATETDISEVFPVISELKEAVRNLADWVTPEQIDAPLTYLGTTSEIHYEPKGTCLIIGPWNYPFNLTIGPLVSCLAAGNTAILKPSELTVHTSRLIRDLVSEFFDEELVTVVEGDVQAATQLLQLPFHHIFFTGSTAVGKVVMRAAAENLSSITLELGGKSPTVIDATANLNDAARRIAFGKFLNVGQTCVAPDYVLIDRTVAREFIELLKQHVIQLFGSGSGITAQSNDYARIVNTKNFNRLQALVQDAVHLGATIELTGTSDSARHFFHPVILSNVSTRSKIMQEEIFGPVLPVIFYHHEDEILPIILERPKPLGFYIFSNRKSFQQKLSVEVSAGAVCINDCVLQFTHPRLPFGGINASGFGKAHGRYGFLAFSNEKPVLKQKSGITMSSFLYPPFTNRVKRTINLMLRWL
ncbi:MAG: aldehyde dehydrogenase family protein [Cyclobacteriaceae bacterium]|nr:aldehyde dehydrogenase family protein [Cyclobacteriaceae bacterium]